MSKRIIMVLLSLTITIRLVLYTRQVAYQQFYTQQRDMAAQTIRVEREKTEKELRQIEQLLKEVVMGEGHFLILFEELDEALYTDALPILAERDYVGVMALSPQSYPGREGCITVEQFNELLSTGWETCLYWPKTMELGDFLEQMAPILEMLALERPTTMDVEGISYSHLKDEGLLKEGFTTVIHHGELGEVIAREDKLPLFYIGVVGWNSGEAVQALRNIINYGGSVAIGVVFSDSIFVGFEEESFAAMCDNLQAQAEKLHLTDLSGMRENLAEFDDNNYYSARKTYLEAELERYDREIEAIYQLDLKELEGKK